MGGELLVLAVGPAVGAIAADTAAVKTADVADTALVAQIPNGPDTAYDTVLAVVDDMLSDRSVVRVAQLEARHGIGRRQIERLFARYVGVGPKWVLARYRMHDVATTLDHGYGGSLTISRSGPAGTTRPTSSGDFTAQVGVTPGQYRAHVAQRRADRPTVASTGCSA